MKSHRLSGSTAIVTGASRGFGRGIAAALAEAGSHVVGVARDHARLAEVKAQLGRDFTPVVADAADPSVAGELIDRYSPQTLVLNAGATPLPRRLQHHTWQSFSRPWEVDVQQVFHWTREALLHPLEPGSVVIAFSSAAALGGSPLTGGYSGAKATVKFIAAYAAAESVRDGLDICFSAVLPALTPATDLGSAATTGYALLNGSDVSTFVANLGPVLTPDQVGASIVDLAADTSNQHHAFRLTSQGLTPVE